MNEESAETSGLVPLRPVGSDDTKVCLLELNAEDASLVEHDGSLFMLIPREDAARYIRFSWDLLRGRIVSLALFEGMPPRRFRCRTREFTKLLTWLPQKPLTEIKKNIRLTGVAIALIGVLFVLVYWTFHWLWGAGFIAVGIMNILLPLRAMYLLNAAWMMAVGVIQLFLRAPIGLDPVESLDGPLPLSTIAGSALLCWATHQVSMNSPNQLIRMALAQRDRDATPTLRKSALVRTVARCNLLTAIALGCYAAGLVVTFVFLRTPSPDSASWELGGVLADLLVFVMLAVLTLATYIVLSLRTRPAYLEAKISAQLLIVVWVLFAWGLGFNLSPSDPLSIFSGTLTRGVFVLERPYVWAPLVVLVVAFNAWLKRAIDRELEDNRH